MKFDMHCHTKEGSPDAQVNILAYIHHLISLGYQGMLVTDHNSYRGYRYWKKYGSSMASAGTFTVLKGIEYDTSNAGHFLVILPDGVHLRLLELRGLPVDALLRIVHHAGGILGPAHPYGNGTLALMNTLSPYKRIEILKKCDFIEAYNGCESTRSNYLAAQLAKWLDKPSFGGSDAHRLSVVGCGYTQFDRTIQSNNDLIRAIKQGAPTKVPPYHSHGMYKPWNCFIQFLLNLGYRLYHKTLCFLVLPARRKELRHHQSSL